MDGNPRLGAAALRVELNDAMGYGLTGARKK